VSRGFAARILLPVLVAALALAALVAAGPDWLYGPVAGLQAYVDEGPALLPSLAYIAIGAIAATLLHEVGHALVALRLLGTPVGVVVGSFGKLAELRLEQIAAGASKSDDSRAEARDILWIALAGPAASLIGLVASIVLLGVAPVHGVAHDLLWAAISCNAFGVLHLLPMNLAQRRDGPHLHTDGRLALEAARTLRALR
jgi:hypothetical protein